MAAAAQVNSQSRRQLGGLTRLKGTPCFFSSCGLSRNDLCLRKAGHWLDSAGNMAAASRSNRHPSAGGTEYLQTGQVRSGHQPLKQPAISQRHRVPAETGQVRSGHQPSARGTEYLQRQVRSGHQPP